MTKCFDQMECSRRSGACADGCLDDKETIMTHPKPLKEPVLLGHWHHGQSHLCCGTMRLLRADFDTNPTEEFRDEVLDWVCDTMNGALAAWNRRTAAQPAPATPAASVERALAELIACEDLLLARGSEKSAEKRRAMTSEHATRFQAALAAGRNALRAHLEKQHG